MKRIITLAVLLLALGMAHAATGGDRLLNTGRAGQPFDYKPMLVAGHINIIDFYSQYCPPCRAIMPRLEKLAAADSHYVVGRVDINRPGIEGIDWQSPVARQYHLTSIPHFIVYDEKGKLIADGDKGYEWVMDTLQKHNL